MWQGQAANRGTGFDLSQVRIHHSGVDEFCRGLGAWAFTVGSDIFVRSDCFAPRTPDGLWLLAHELAHVVQQRLGPVSAALLTADCALAPRAGFEEAEADAAADALLAGRPFRFAVRSAGQAAGDRRERAVIQRYMAWEHLVLGNANPTGRLLAGPSAGDRVRQELKTQCAVLDELGASPLEVDEDALRERYQGLQTLRLTGSGLVITVGELNTLPDYLSRPEDVDDAPAAFIVPLVQAIRSRSFRELSRLAGHRARDQHWGDLRYPHTRLFTDVREAMEVDALGKKCRFPPWERYSSVVSRNAGHFAPFSWYRWQHFHRQARELIGRAGTLAGDERDRLRARARLYAGYADHFLQDSFAAGHLANKTLIMQWYVEWLIRSAVPFCDRGRLSAMTVQWQPFLHAPELYEPAASADGKWLYPDGNAARQAIGDPQSVVDAPTREERIQTAGLVGADPAERDASYANYLALLASGVAQLAAGVVHAYFNDHSLMVASRMDDASFRLWGDWTLFRDDAGLGHVAIASYESRRAIADLLEDGQTSITGQQIFSRFPCRVRTADGELVSLPQWQEGDLRELCFSELFPSRKTQFQRFLISLTAPQLGVPSADHQRRGAHGG